MTTKHRIPRLSLRLALGAILMRIGLIVAYGFRAGRHFPVTMVKNDLTMDLVGGGTFATSTIRRSQRGAADPVLLGASVLGILLVVGIAVGAIMTTAQVGHVSACTVIDKDRTKNSDGTSDARVYTENCGTFGVGDSLFDGHWSSADTFASIRVGETYDFKTRGVRVPFLSMFPNIVEVTAR